VRQVALALEFAHRNDVLHRDLKPSNIMLTTDGRALLFDFGLASSRDAGRMTRTGSQVGSLAYMAPEQLRGEALDARTDVYGLGAVLCELLTLETPHGELSGDALVQAVLRGEPIDVRSANRAISRDVGTLCRKALEGEPSRRYASAAALARDLDNALARRPIEARRTGPLMRAMRWAQRHPARALALVLAIGAPAALAVQRDRASARIEAQRDRAEANLGRAVRAIEVFLWEVGGESLAATPHMETTRLRLLEEALLLFDELSAQQPDDLARRLRWASLQRSIGDVLAMLDSLPDAEVCFRNQLAVLRAVETQDAGQRDELAGCLNALGNTVLGQGRQDEAIALYEQARDLLEDEHAARSPDRLTTVQRNLGNVLEAQGRWPEADEAYDAAARAAEAMVDAADDPWLARSELGKVLLARALLQHGRGDAFLARELVHRALALLVECAQQAPEDPVARAAAASACMNAGAMESPDEAEPILRVGIELAESLAADYPATPDYARTLASLQQNLGLTQRALGRWDAAEASLQRGLETSARTTDRHPDVIDNQLALGLAGTNLASLRVEIEQRSGACEPGAQAVQAFTHALTLRPGDAAIEHQLAWARIQEGYGRAARGEVRRVEELIEPLAELAPGDAGVFIARAELLALCAALDDARSTEFETRALASLERGLELGFRDLSYLRGCVELRGLASTPRFLELLSGVELDSRP
jgi:tetratricopeptide (TPR) repeat protein